MLTTAILVHNRRKLLCLLRQKCTDKLNRPMHINPRRQHDATEFGSDFILYCLHRRFASQSQGALDCTVSWGICKSPIQTRSLTVSRKWRHGTVFIWGHPRADKDISIATAATQKCKDSDPQREVCTFCLEKSSNWLITVWEITEFWKFWKVYNIE